MCWLTLASQIITVLNKFKTMSLAIVIVLILSARIGYAQQSRQSVIDKNIPDISQLSGVWVNADTTATEPSLRNFRAQGILDRDMTSISWFARAPFSGGYHSGVLRINGKAPRAQLFRWQPWEGLRKSVNSTYSIQTSVRMAPDHDIVMWNINIVNNTKQTQQYNITQDLIGFISNYDKEIWAYPYPYPTLKGKHTQRQDEIVNVIDNIGLAPKDIKAENADTNGPGQVKTATKPTWPTDDDILDSKKYTVLEHTANKLVIADTETQCFIGFYIEDTPDNLSPRNSGGTAKWQINLKPSAHKNIRFFMTYGSSRDAVEANISQFKTNFNQTFAGVENTWRERWRDLFVPGNNLISGNFPVLQTNDAAAKKVYYTGPLTFLYLLNLDLPAHTRVVLTVGPKWGASVVFFWDSAEWSSIYALADPVMMKEDLKDWIANVDLDKHYGKDNFGGGGIGNAYRANYWAIFQMVYSYITVTGDYGFLNETIKGVKLIDIIDSYAQHWKKMALYGQPGCTDDIYKLADFGDDEWNLLECVPTYKHVVPSFNVGYVWMMRKTADFYKRLGQPGKAAYLNTEADSMAHRVLKLYAGNGVWNVLYPGNKTIEQRHVLDFIFFGKFMGGDIPADTVTAMVNFVNNELLTHNWMRAQSLLDVAAKNSDRPDHGPLGAFDGWPPATMDALTQLGYKQQAFAFYDRVAPVTNEGCWAQAHELWDSNKFNKMGNVRIASRGWTSREAVDGIAFSQIMLKDFMGFYPDAFGRAINVPAQKIPFTGTLYNVKYNGKYYNIKCLNGDIKMNLYPKTRF
jgi:hypothetical protein